MKRCISVTIADASFERDAAPVVMTLCMCAALMHRYVRIYHAELLYTRESYVRNAAAQ